MSDFDSYLASASSTAQPQQASFDDYLKQAQPAQEAPTAVANPSGWQLPQPIQDIRNWVSEHGLGSSPQDFYAAAGHNLMKPLHGAAQLAEHGIGGAANLIAPGSSVAQFFNQDNAQNDAYLRKWEQDYQDSTPTNAGTLAGAAIGQAAPLVAGAGEKLAQGADYLAGLIPKAPQLVKNIVSGATQGGLLGAIQPVTAPSGNSVGDLVQGTVGPSFLDQKMGQIGAGALTGGALSGAGGVLSGIGKGLQPLINPQATARSYVGNLLGDQAPQVLQNLQSAPTFVPGSMPTAAQVAGSPELVMAEKALSNQFPAFKAAQMARSNANNAARMDTLQQLAGTPEEQALMQADRKAAVGPWIDKNLSDSRPITRWTNAAQPFEDILSKPMARNGDFHALQDAQKIVNKVKNGSMQEDDGIEALNELGDSVSGKAAQDAFAQANAAINHNMVDPTGVLNTLKTIRNGPMGVDPFRGSTLDSLISSIQNGQNIRGMIGTDMLDAVRQQASKALGNANPQSSIALGNAKDSIVNAIDRVTPGYRDYLGDYRTMSQGLTDARAASGILDRLGNGSLNSAQQVQLTPRGFNAAMKQATKGPYPLSPNAQGTLEGIQNDLQRDTVSNAVRSAGSDTRYNMAADSWLANKLYGPTYGGNGTLPKLVGGALGSFIPGVGTLGGYLGMGKLAEKGAERLGGAVTDLMMDPAKMASAIQQLQRTNPAAASQLQRLLNQQSSELVGQKAGQ